MFKLTNTLTRKKEEFKPISPGKILFYHCGPTVYWTQHIGNLRAMTMGDLLVRSLRYFDYEVKYVRNYTDVGHLTSDSDTGEDKMEKGAKREGLSPDQIADKYIKIFERDTALLNLTEPTYKPRATEYIGQMIDMVRTLLDKGFAYSTALAVYFDVSKFKNYNQLNRQDMNKLQEGAGSAEVSDPQKKNPVDFALWFFKKGVHSKALQTWESPFVSESNPSGVGFPGWHIECSVMAKSLLADTIDIHLGGIEHIPVHHTNEIAQSEAANGVKFVNYWLHNGHLLVNGNKMAKSEGTGYSLQEVMDKGFEPLALRYFYLNAHYRSSQNFTWKAMKQAQESLNQLRSYYISLKQKKTERLTLSAEKMKKVDGFRTDFNKALENDLNIPRALAVTWETIKSNIPSQDKLDLITDFDRVLGLKLEESPDRKADIPEKIKELVVTRQKLRKESRFEEADKIRKEIENAGYLVEDTPGGYQIKKN